MSDYKTVENFQLLLKLNSQNCKNTNSDLLDNTLAQLTYRVIHEGYTPSVLLIFDGSDGLHRTTFVNYKGTYLIGIRKNDGDLSVERASSYEEVIRKLEEGLEQITARPKIPASFAGQLALPGFQLPAANLTN